MQSTRILIGVLFGALLSATLPTASARADCCFVDGDYCFTLGESECGAYPGIYEPTGSCVNGQCIPESPCTTDAECLDPDVCDGTESCVAGRCVDGTPPDCQPDDTCTTGICDPERGCVLTPVADGTWCAGETLACVGDGVCYQGMCISEGPPVCDDRDLCNGVEVCEIGSGCVTMEAVPPLVRLHCLVSGLEVSQLCRDEPYSRVLDRVVSNHRRVLLRWIERLQADGSPPRNVALLAVRRLLLETRRDILRRGGNLVCKRDLVERVDRALEVLMELGQRGD